MTPQILQIMDRNTLKVLLIFGMGFWPISLLSETGGNADQESVDLSLLRSELAFEESLRAAEVSGSQLPIPDFDASGIQVSEGLSETRIQLDTVPAPEVDGELVDVFWNFATVFLWKDIGDSKFGFPWTWRIRVAMKGDDIYLAGERAGPVSPQEFLILQANWRERLVLTFVSGGDSTARAECPSSTEPIDRHGGEFSARVGNDVVSWELKLNRQNTIWQLPIGSLRPLRILASRGTPGELYVSPEIRLLPAPMALRVESMETNVKNEVTANVTLMNYSAITEEVWLPEFNRKEVPAHSRLPLKFSNSRLRGMAGIQWDFRIGSLGCKLGLISNFVDFGDLPQQITTHVNEALEMAQRISLEKSPGLRKVFEEKARDLKEKIQGGVRSELQELNFQARLLRRQCFMSSVSGLPDEIIFTSRYHYRYGPFFTTYLDEMAGGNLNIWSIKTGKLRPLLDMPIGGSSVRDPDLHHDGQRIVFSMRKRSSPSHLFSIKTDGSDFKQITRGEGHDIEPCFLPNNQIVFGSTRVNSTNPSTGGKNYCLHIVSEDGSGLQRLSYNYLVDFTPTVMPDGRILFLRWVQEDKPGYFVNALWTMYPDGREQRGFFGMNRIGVSIEPVSIPGTNLVACLDAGQNGHWRSPLVGDIGVIDVHVNRNEYLYKIKAPRGGFKNPYPVGDDSFLVSWGWVDSGWAIYLVGRHGNHELIFRDPILSCFDPIPIRPRPQPNRIPSLRSRDDSAPSTLFIQDIYEGLEGVPRNTIGSLRVVAVPDRPHKKYDWGFLDQEVPISVINRMVRRDLGTVPVYSDGSAYFQVPNNLSVFFQALDKDGFAVQTMRDTVCFAPGERQSCIGCHEPQRVAPPGGGPTVKEAMRHPPAQLQPPSGSPSISFPRDIQPILDQYCVQCHDAEDPAGGISLSGDLTPYFSLAYESLTRGGSNDNNQYWNSSQNSALASATGYTVGELRPGSTGSRASRLMNLLEDGHQDVQMQHEDRQELARWIDLNLPYYDDWDSTRSSNRRRLLSGHAEGALTSFIKLHCRGCHLPPDLFRGAAVSLSRPRMSPILMAPLPRSHGGTGFCKKPVFKNREDPVYRDILKVLMTEHREMEAGKK